MIPTTTERVSRNTAGRVNEAISQQARDHVAEATAASPQRMDARLNELAWEWDIERIMDATAGVVVVGGVLLTALVSEAFLAVLALAGVFLLWHALIGWSPLHPLLRTWGVRTPTEIAQERYALKALRGDFQQLTAVTTPQDREDIARMESEGGPPVPPPHRDAADPKVVDEAMQATQP